MTITIRSRFSGTVLKTVVAETLRNADLRNADLRNADLRGADLYDADLYDANLRGANLRNADLRNADLYDANLRGANLRNADLRGADLRGADLYDADLRGADLGGANGPAIGWVAQTRRSDGYDFILFRMEKGELIRAGCRTFTLREFRAHVASQYPATPKAGETLAILAYLAKRLKQTA